MLPGRYNLALYRGDSFMWRHTLWADADRTVPVDLTGAEVASEVRDRSAGAVVVSLDVIVELPNTVFVSITPDMWTGMPPAGVWDLQVTYPDGTVKTVLAGAVAVTADVTDSSAPALMSVLTSRRRVA